MSKIDVKVPDIGDFKNVPIIEILVKVGDQINIDDPLVSLESDKATLEVPSPQKGKVVDLLVKVGDKVSLGSPLLYLEVEGAETEDTVASSPRPSAPAAVQDAQDSASSISKKPAEKNLDLAVPVDVNFDGFYASPSVRRLVRELDLDLKNIKGTGEKGRITKEDVKAALEGSSPGTSTPAMGSGIPEIPLVDFSKFGPVETKPISRIKRLSGPHLHRAWLNIPHVTHVDEADITETEAFRKELDDQGKNHKKKPYRVSLLPFLMKAAVSVLKIYPEFNASLNSQKDALVYKKYYHIGIAVDTPDGLVVPVLRDVDRKGILELSRELGELSAKARESKLAAQDMQGGTFSISSLGGIGGTAFSPIVNAPEVAILGVVRSKMAPVWDGKEFKPRLMLPLCLSYDHRVVDGAAAARFTRDLAQSLKDVRHLLL